MAHFRILTPETASPTIQILYGDGTHNYVLKVWGSNNRGPSYQGLTYEKNVYQYIHNNIINMYPNSPFIKYDTNGQKLAKNLLMESIDSVVRLSVEDKKWFYGAIVMYMNDEPRITRDNAIDRWRRSSSDTKTNTLNYMLSYFRTLECVNCSKYTSILSTGTSEQIAWAYINIINAIKHMFTNRIVHNDLHSDNTFVYSNNSQFAVYDFDRSYMWSIGDNPMLSAMIPRYGGNYCSTSSQCNNYIPDFPFDVYKSLSYIILGCNRMIADRVLTLLGVNARDRNTVHEFYQRYGNFLVDNRDNRTIVNPPSSHARTLARIIGTDIVIIENTIRRNFLESQPPDIRMHFRRALDTLDYKQSDEKQQEEKLRVRDDIITELERRIAVQRERYNEKLREEKQRAELKLQREKEHLQRRIEQIQQRLQQQEQRERLRIEQAQRERDQAHQEKERLRIELLQREQRERERVQQERDQAQRERERLRIELQQREQQERERLRIELQQREQQERERLRIEQQRAQQERERLRIDQQRAQQERDQAQRERDQAQRERERLRIKQLQEEKLRNEQIIKNTRKQYQMQLQQYKMHLNLLKNKEKSLDTSAPMEVEELAPNIHYRNMNTGVVVVNNRPRKIPIAVPRLGAGFPVHLQARARQAIDAFKNVGAPRGIFRFPAKVMPVRNIRNIVPRKLPDLRPKNVVIKRENLGNIMNSSIKYSNPPGLKVRLSTSQYTPRDKEYTNVNYDYYYRADLLILYI